MTAGTTDKKRPIKIGRNSLPNEVTLALGMNLKMVREAAGITQVDLAFDAEVERSRISKIERGHVNPSLLTLATLCYCLDVTLPELFTGITATMAPTWRGGELRRSNQATLNKSEHKNRRQQVVS